MSSVICTRCGYCASIVCDKHDDEIARLRVEVERLSTVPERGARRIREMEIAYDALCAERNLYRKTCGELSRECDALVAVAWAADWATYRRYHDLSFLDPPSYHGEDFDGCGMCSLKRDEALVGALAHPAVQARLKEAHDG